MIDIKGYEGEYAATEDGRIWSYPKKKNNVKGKFLKGSLNHGGYLRLKLCKKGVKSNVRLHRLVAHAFIPNPYNKPCVNHKDGIKTNNHIDNLEWCTVAENNLHAFRTGLRGCFITIDDASEICEAYATKLFSQRELGECFNVSKNTISRVINNKWVY